MAILVVCQDAAGAPALRKQHLKAHLDYIEKILDQICVAGPLSQGEAALHDGSYDGSCLIYATDDMDTARVLFNNDPYARAGIFSSASFSRFNTVAGDWVGGKSW